MADNRLSTDVDHEVQLDPGEGIWLTVTNQFGEQLTVRVGVDLPTGALKVGTFLVGKEDERPIDELLINFS